MAASSLLIAHWENAMELHLGSRHWEARMPDWPAAAVAGFIGGATLMVLELLWSITGGENPWIITHKIAGITLGSQAVASSDFSVGIVALALATHYVLGMLFGCLLAVILSAARLDDSPGMALAIGAAFGVLLYVFSFYVMSRAYPWFVDMRTLETFIGHLIFGMVTGFTYWRMRRQ
jgi:hypothetical protein